MRKFVFVTTGSIVGLSLLMLLLLMSGASQAKASGPAEPIYDVWQFADPSAFAFTRFDAEYSPTTEKVYILGGRLADGNTDGSVWEFDPMTGVYTDMGVDMPVPVSNYSIARVVDGGSNEILMLFGGRPAAGGVTNVIQGYLPATNSVVNFSPADVYPFNTAPGGIEVVDNLVYIFGGFDAATVVDNTYIFDITASAGSRFSAGPPLNLARSYMATAVVDGVIYAIGGDDWDGASLIAVDIVEKLDTANPVAWDDASVADLPLPCDENRAVGFDSTTLYDLAGTVVVAGCGQWSDELPESLLYDVASNTWDAAFPDLNDARRNHAGTFIPLGDGTDGLPGIWIWGGRQASDSTVLNTVEYYTVVPLSELTLSPRDQTIDANGTVSVTLNATNLSGADETFDLAYAGSATWTIDGPAAIFVPDGETISFVFTVVIPEDAACFAADEVEIVGTGQVSMFTDTVFATIRQFCPTGITGTILDANTGLGIPQAYIYMEKVDDDSVSEETFADSSGVFTITEVMTGTYYIVSSAQGYLFTPQVGGWPTATEQVTIDLGVVLSHDLTLDAPLMSWSENGFWETLPEGSQVTRTLTITNDGTSDLVYAIDTMENSEAPLVTPVAPWLSSSKIDPRILSDISASPEGTADFIIVMQEQADLRLAYGMADWDARGEYVYQTLAALAEQSQAAIRAELTQKGIEYRPFIATNGLLVRAGDMELANQMAARADVAFLMANDEVLLETFRPSVADQLSQQLLNMLTPITITWGVQAVNADDVWVDNGVLGEGIVVANIDTGVEWTHEALVNQYRGGVGDHDYNWYMPTSGCAGATEPCDNDGHGSHTMGTMVGSITPTDPLSDTNMAIGVAPGAQWIACKGCEGRGCSYEALLACGDWMVAPTDLNGENPDPSQRPHIINNSWGGGGGDFWYGGVVAAWRASGMFPQFSAGNSGPTCSTTGSPGDYWSSFDAAAVNVELEAAGFSSRGPADVTGILKPNISGPGVRVYSSIPGNTYAFYGGTSMASPHVAGVIALLWSAKPELIGQVEDTMWLLSQTATPLYTVDGCGGDTADSHPNHTYGWGLVDAAAAVTSTMQIVPSWVIVTPDGGVVAPGESQTVDVVFTAPMSGGTYDAVLQLTADEPYNPEVMLPLSLYVGPRLFLPIIFSP
ncbi:MAG: S8 family serine peptidase [Ardenticatenaceae bacterium]|nr:S8 family serine peptidase [Ardenticatenaceae bacterium]